MEKKTLWHLTSFSLQKDTSNTVNFFLTVWGFRKHSCCQCNVFTFKTVLYPPSARKILISEYIFFLAPSVLPQCQKGREGEEGNQSNTEKSSTNLLLWILHSTHGCGGSARHSHGIALGAGRAVGLPRVGAALLRLRVRVIAHAVQLRSLHDHWVHWAALLNTNKQIC